MHKKRPPCGSQSLGEESNLPCTNPGARQITADALRAAADALAPEQEETSSSNEQKSTNEARQSVDDRYAEKNKVER